MKQTTNAASTPRTSPIGGSYSKKILELLTVDSGSTRRDEHAYIDHSSGRAKFFELGSLNYGNFAPKMPLFSAIMLFFSPLEAGRPALKCLNESSDLKLTYDEKVFGINCTPSPL